MGITKSFRLNARAESMFNVIKFYHDNRGGISDTEIFVNGIEMQYENAVQDLNSAFKSYMEEKLSIMPDVLSLFYSICNMLEVLSYSEGNTIEDQFSLFIAVNDEFSTVFTIDKESKERQPKTVQYAKAWENIRISEGRLSGCGEEELDNKLTSIGDAFREYAKK